VSIIRKNSTQSSKVLCIIGRILVHNSTIPNVMCVTWPSKHHGNYHIIQMTHYHQMALSPQLQTTVTQFPQLPTNIVNGKQLEVI